MVTEPGPSLDALKDVLARANANPTGPASLVDVEDALNDVAAVFGQALKEVRSANAELAARVETLEAVLEEARRNKPRIPVRAAIGKRPAPEDGPEAMATEALQ
ncbi:hypothetical protein [Thalassobaculum sp.]|uniref:hypothetical protein n=1 Tax=Thalassobaculum sp. TaxID=2022740 RepID=UPI003B5C30DB